MRGATKRDAKRPGSRPRVVVVAKRTAYRRFVEEERDPRAKALLRRRDPAVANWLDAHREHQRTVESVLRDLEASGAQVMLVERAHAAFDASDATLVVPVGGDGTLLAASHSVVTTPVLGVNSAPRHSVGFFCSAQRATFRAMLERALTGKLASIELTRMAVAVNGRLRTKHVLNEALYSHASPAATSRYLLTHGKRTEEQRSSGFWIGPAAGSTAAQRSAGGRLLPLNSRLLQLVVREPYTPSGKPYALTRLAISD
ncbi:MAG TPA: NAD(+)/NADH kinase, partial [Polyangiaceae bacterium]|nr:NAD(+)/NADH kinase [Polyangiaceae bacterium]